MFLVYYIIDNTGYKMAREALWPCWAGMWLSTLVLIPIGVFLTYKATTDSAIFNPDAWLGYYRKAVGMIKRAFRTLKKISVSSKKA
jgi:lipopolysaccharide export system permease protein